MQITIETPQRKFITYPSHWLGKSKYFDNLLSGQWGDKRPDGSYFIETDGDVFEDILRYLRTAVLPVFYDRDRGHDFVRYHALLQEAKYFGIGRLEKWLCTSKYLQAVRMTVRTTESDKQTFNGLGSMDVQVTPMVVRENVYYCPSGVHDATSQKCRAKCTDLTKRDIGGGWRSEDELKWCVVRKEITFDHDLCVNAFLDDD